MFFFSEVTNFFVSIYQSLSTNPHHRTNTRTQSTFHLQHPAPVTFDFTSLSTAGLTVTIPHHSAWRTPTYWHKTTLFCETLECISGYYLVTTARLYEWGDGTDSGPGPQILKELAPDDMIAWSWNPYRSVDDPVDSVYALKGSPEMMAFYRQICSVNQDAEVYFSLPSTPLWLRLLYASLKYIPRVREWLVSGMLWVQLRVIYYKNDYHTYEGRINYTRPLINVGIPTPTEEQKMKELKSLVTVSWLVQKSCYWVGTILLGMRERYEEYEAPAEGTDGEQKGADGEKGVRIEGV
jgi:hypothetical protein